MGHPPGADEHQRHRPVSDSDDHHAPFRRRASRYRRPQSPRPARRVEADELLRSCIALSRTGGLRPASEGLVSPGPPGGATSDCECPGASGPALSGIEGPAEPLAEISLEAPAEVSSCSCGGFVRCSKLRRGAEMTPKMAQERAFRRPAGRPGGSPALERSYACRRAFPACTFRRFICPNSPFRIPRENPMYIMQCEAICRMRGVHRASDWGPGARMTGAGPNRYPCCRIPTAIASHLDGIHKSLAYRFGRVFL